MTGFHDIPSIQSQKENLSRRISKRDVLPTEVRFRLMEFINPATGNLEVKDNSGNIFLTINRSTGVVTFGAGALGYTFSANEGITSGAELYRPVGFEHTFTGSDTYLDNTGSEFIFDADDFPGFDFG